MGAAPSVAGQTEQLVTGRGRLASRRAEQLHGDGPGCVGEVGLGAGRGQAVEGVVVVTVVIFVRPSASGSFLWTRRAVNIDARPED